MIRLLGFLALALLVACTPPQRGPLAPVAKQCRIGPDGGPVLADRGIGGTGTPSTALAAREGGDRGIGGTGIVGVVTGFASVCVDGAEVAYDTSTPVTVDDATADPAILRAGQVVVVQARGTDDQLVATHIAVQHQVVGPVAAESVNGTTLMVAGQKVVLDGPSPGAAMPRTGDWIAVSGLMDPDGVIHATRLDPAPVGRVLIRGLLRGTAAAPMVGGAKLRPAAGQTARPGQPVIVSGHFVGGRLVVDRLTPDALAIDPPHYFGSQVHRYVIESYVVQDAGRVTFSGGFHARGSGAAAQPARAIVSLRRAQGGRVEVIRVGRPDAPWQPATGSPPGQPTGQSGGQTQAIPGQVATPTANDAAPSARTVPTTIAGAPMVPLAVPSAVTAHPVSTPSISTRSVSTPSVSPQSVTTPSISPQSVTTPSTSTQSVATPGSSGTMGGATMSGVGSSGTGPILSPSVIVPDMGPLGGPAGSILGHGGPGSPHR